MRAALGLMLLAGGGVLALLALRGRTPFDATSASGGAASAASGASGTVDPANRIGGASELVSRFGGTP